MLAQTWPNEEMWVEVGPGGRARILAEVNRFIPEFPFDAEQVEIHAAFLEFYGDEFFLARFAGNASAESASRPAQAFALIASGDIYPLDQSNKPIYRVNEIAPLVLDSWKKAADYLRFFLAYYKNTTKGRYILAEGDHPWDCLVQLIEKGELKKPLLKEVNKLDPHLPNWFEFEAVLLTENPKCFYKAWIIVDRNGNVSFSKEDPTELGVGSYPDINNLVKFEDLRRVVRPVRWIKEWQKVDDDKEKSVFVKCFKEEKGSELPLFDEQSVTLRKYPLQFYPGYFLSELILSNASKYSQFYALYKYKPDGDENNKGCVLALQVLDGTSTPIHDVNDLKAIDLSDDQKRIEYLMFFCWAVAAEEGNFHVAQRFRDIPWSVVPSDEESRSKIKDKLKLKGITEKKNDNLDVIVCYGNAIFEAEFEITEDGLVTMIKDDLFVEVRLSPEETVNAWAKDRRKPAKKGEEFPHYLRNGCQNKTAISTSGPGFKETIRAELFVDLLLRNGTIADKNVEGDVCVPCGDEMLVQVCLRNITFKGKFSVRNVHFKCNVLICECRFEQGLDGRGATLNGSFSAFLVVVSPQDHHETAVNLQGLRAEGSLAFVDCNIHGRFFAPGIVIRGDTLFTGLRILKKDPEGWFPDDALDKQERPIYQTLQESINKKELRDPNEWSVRGGFVLRGAEIGGNLRITSTFEEPEPELYYDPAHSRTIIGGDIDLAMSRISGNLGLTSICVLGNLDLQGAHISGILICIADIDRIQSKRTRFQVTGNFYISFSTIEQHVVLHGADVGGNIELDAATIKGSVCAGGEIPLVVGGDLILSAAKISWIHFAAAKISGKISCVTGEFSQLKFDAGLVRTSRWDGIEEHWICPCQAAGVVIRSISVKDKASLLGIKVHHGGQGSSDGEGKGSLIFTGSTVGNDLTLGEDETVDKILAQVDRSKGSIQWNPCPDTLSDRHPLYFEFNPPQDRDLGGHVRVDVDLSGTVVGGAMNLSALFTGEIICLAKASVGGDLKAPRLGTSRSSGSRVSTVCGHLNMDMLSIGGDASLTGLKVEKLKDELIPDVYARGLTVKGKIEFANNGDKDCAQIEGVLDLSKASANELVISGSVLQKTGSADLKGVRPKGCLQRMLNGFILLLSAPIKGMLDLLRKFVDGILSLCLRFLWWCLGGQPPKFDRETIDSKFALDKIGFTRKRDILLYVLALRYSQGCTGVDDAFRHTRHMVDKHREALGQSFAKVLLKISKAPKEPVLVLERASFDRLDFLKPFPLDVDLSGIRVGKWEAGADDMQRILEKTTPFYRGTYLDVEKALKSKGYESQAAKIYRTMRLKAENDLSGWRWLGSWLAGRFTGYWTQSWRLVPIFLASFVLTFSVFDNQANVVAVTGVLEVQGSDRGPKTLGEKLAQKPIDLDRDILWTWQDAAGLTVRYTIPVVSLFPAERWIPGRELLKVTLPTCKLYDSLGHKNQASLCADWWWESSWITPEFFAMFVSAIMWLAWPVFLVGISGVIRREK